MNKTRSTIRIVRRWILSVGLIAAFAAGPLQAHEAAGGSAGMDEEKLIQRIKEAVLRELSEGALLDKAIDAGIERAAERKKIQAVQAEQRKAANMRPVSAGRDHILGNPDAEISLVEYSDFECPFCKRFHATPKALVESYGGEVNWVYRHFPLKFHNPAAQKEAEAAECAAELGGNEAFWRYTDLTYERSQSNGKGYTVDRLVQLAREIGLDDQSFRVCVDSGRHSARVQQDAENGVSSGISGTPGSILVSHKTGAIRVIAGAKPLAYIKAEIDRMLGEAAR